MSDDQTIDRNQLWSRESDASSTATLSISGGAPVEVVGLVTIGRDPKSATGRTIEITGDPLVSKLHLALRIESGKVTVTDLGSSNGTFLHGAGSETRVPTDRWISVPPGSELEFGDQRMTVRSAEQPSAEPLIDADVAASKPACSVCATPLIPGARFCDTCGTPSPLEAPGPSNWFDDSVAPAPDPNLSFIPEVAPEPLAVAIDRVAPAEPSFVAPQVPTSTSHGTTKKVVAAIAGLLVLGLIAFALVRVLGGDNDDASGTSDLPELPLTIDEQWSESVRGDQIGSGVGASGVYVASRPTDDGYTLTRLASADGNEDWEVTVDASDPVFVQLVGEYDDAVVVQSCGSGDCSVVGIDNSTGEVTWDRSSSGFSGVRDIDGRLLFFEEDSVERIDPEDGRRIERIRADTYVESAGSTLAVRDGDSVEVFDLELQSVFGPIDIDSGTSAFTFTGSQVVAVVGNDLQFLDDDGDVVIESKIDDVFDAVFDAVVVESLTFVGDDNIVVEGSDAIVSVDPIDGEADERWSVDGELNQVFAVDGEILMLIDKPDESGEVIDAATGDQRMEVDEFAEEEKFVIAFGASDGLLVLAELPDSSEIEARALAWEDGDEIWAEQFDGWVSFGAGVFVEVTADGDVTLFR
jgi:hypothetical protein